MTTQVILLASGTSSRMWPLSDKMLFRYFGHSLLEHQINSLVDNGFTDIIIVTNKDNQQPIKEDLEKKPKLQAATINYAVQTDLSLGIMGGVKAGSALLKTNHSLLVVSSNDFVEEELIAKIRAKISMGESSVLIVGKVVDNYFPGGYLEINSDLTIKSIVEKPGAENTPSNLVNLMFHWFQNPQKLLSAYEKVNNNKDDAHEQALQLLFSSPKLTSKVIEYPGKWQALKYPWHHLELMQHFFNSLSQSFIHTKAKVSKTAIINGPVIIEEGAQILDFAVIKGPAYIGKNTIIGNHTLIRDSHLASNVVIGQGSEISRSFLSAHCWTHQNFIGDSVFDSNVSLGAGTKTGNLRLDEEEVITSIKNQKTNSYRQKLGSFIGQNVRIGINTSLMPGVKIAPGSFLAAGMVVEKDTTENSFIYQKTALQKKPNQKTAPIRD